MIIMFTRYLIQESEQMAFIVILPLIENWLLNRSAIYLVRHTEVIRRYTICNSIPNVNIYVNSTFSSMNDHCVLLKLEQNVCLSSNFCKLDLLKLYLLSLLLI